MFGRVLLTALFAATLVSAQGRGGGGGRGGGMGGDAGGMGGGMRTQPKTKLDQFAEKLKLNDQQIKEVNGIFTEAVQKVAPVRTDVDKSRAEIAGAIIQGKSEDDLKKLMEAHTALEAQVDGLEAEAFAKVFAILKPNQQAKAGQAFELMAGAFDRAGGPGQGGGRGGRRGR